MTSQTPLANYVDYYKKLNNPGFAALITGDWGSSKTYQVKKALLPEEYHYISLFGLSSETDVYGAVFAKLSPEGARGKKLANWLDNKNVGAAGITLPVGSLLGAALNALVREEVDSSKLLVFDDLERSPLDTKVLLGIINTYVEHHGCRVIVIAHDEKMVCKFIEAKEKIFGQTIKVAPQTDDAFSAFIKDLGKTAQTHIVQHEKLLKDIFFASKCQSLRVLRHVLLDIDRFLGCLEDAQLESEVAIAEILGFITAISIDLRSGRLHRTDVKNRMMAYVSNGTRSNRNRAGKSQAEISDAPPIVVSFERYKSLTDLTGYVLSDELIEAMLLDGSFDKSAIQAHIQTLPAFQSDTEKPLWWKFWQYRTTPTEKVHSIISEIDKKFASFEFHELGEVFHIIAILFSRIDYGFENWDPNRTEQRAKDYLTKLVDLGHFPAVLPKYLDSGFLAYGCYSISFPKQFNNHFAAIRIHINDCQKLTWQRNKGTFKSQIVDWLHNNRDELNAALNIYNRETNSYSDIPVLVSIAPEEFVAEFLKSKIEDRTEISGIFLARKNKAQHDQTLVDEMLWFAEVDRIIVKTANELGDPIAKRQLMTVRFITDAEYEAEQREKPST